MNGWIVDIEGDSLNPTKIHVLSATKNGTKVHSTTDYNEMRQFLLKAKVIIGHNFKRFDLGVLERLLGIKIEAKIIDTLGLSWSLFPTRTSHGLESWGETFGIPKPQIDDWENLPIEEYIKRCEEDVKINYRLWCNIWNLLQELYNGKQEDIHRYIDYISFKMEQARLKEKSGWKLDIEYAEKNLIELLSLQKEKLDILSSVMPKVPVYKTKKKPKKLFNQFGGYTKIGYSWVESLKIRNLPEDTEEFNYIDGYEEPNPNSHDQLKSWLFELGWKPQTYKQVKNKKTGKIKEVPQINKEKQKGGGVCESIKLLYEKEPNLSLLDGLSVLNHRIGILSGFIRDVSNDGYLKAKISGFTNTLRVKHTEIVNLPKINIEYGEILRGCLIAPEGYELCGADMSGLEDMLKQHYIFPHDPEYVESMNKPDWDPHLDIALLSKRMTEKEVQDYKNGDHSKKIIRDIMKNVNYACQYGAGPHRISITGGVTFNEAKKLHETYWKRNKAIKDVANEQTWKEVNGLKWLFNPVSRFWYYLKEEKDIFSTLVQGTASYCFDTWLKYILEKRSQLTADFHDEGVWTIKKGYRELCSKLLTEAINKTNEELQLNKILGISIQYGTRYSEIH